MGESKPSRREVLGGLGGALGVAAIGCAGASEPPVGEAAVTVDAGAPAPDAPVEDVDLCAAAGDTGAASAALAEIETIVVLCMENRSFDHVFGSLQLLEGRDDVDGLAGSEVNLTAGGDPVHPFLLTNFEPEDPPHKWDECHRQWNGGNNDGFVTEHTGASEAEVMGYHTRDQISQIYALADGGVLCNRWFSSVLGPTWPNRYYLHGGTAHGLKSNLPVFEFRSIFDALSESGISHKNYFHDVPWAAAYQKTTGLDLIENFFEDAAAGTLPQFSIVDPHFFGAGANDDHPKHDMRLGQALIGSVFAALAQSPQWSKCLFVLTYDEHGGFYDHVAPPTTVDSRSAFRQLGFRVPSVVAGPLVRQGCPSDVIFDHTSVASTVCRRFGLEPLNERVAAANDLSACLDPQRIGNPAAPPPMPPVVLPRSVVRDRAHLTVDDHPEIAAAIEAPTMPAELDRRSDGIAIAERVLDYGERLGSVKFL